MSLPWVLNDLDDTLIGARIGDKVCAITDIYDHCIDRFGDAMAALGFNKAEAIAAQDRIDRAMCQTHGFGDKTRFGESMAVTYETLSRETAISPSKKFRDQMFSIGMSVFTDYPYALRPHAEAWLATARQTHRVALVTKGDVTEQWKKINAVGLADQVDEVVVLADKHVEDWHRVVRHTLAMHDALVAVSWAVGDSVKSDINPALTVGLNAIHIPVSTAWDFEHAEYREPLRDRQRLTLGSLAEVVEHFGKRSTN